MPGFLISCLMLLLLLAGSCSQASTAHKSPPDKWSLQLTTSGGFAGVGRGNLSVDSDGRCEFSQANRQDVRSSVTGPLYPRQLQPISEAVAQAKPNEWNKPGLNVAAPDAFGYKLELRTGNDYKDVTTVQWYDNTSDQLPADLKKLRDALFETIKHPCAGPP